MIPFLITIVTLWIIRIPLSALLSTRFGTDGIWWGIPAAWTMGSTLSTVYYLSGRWRRRWWCGRSARELMRATKPRALPQSRPPRRERQALALLPAPG